MQIHVYTDTHGKSVNKHTFDINHIFKNYV